jgi:hypothetical protein
MFLPALFFDFVARLVRRRVPTALQACSDVYPDIASRCSPPYPTIVHWGAWVCTIEPRSNSGWNFDCRDNGTWTCRFSVTPDSSDGTGSPTVLHAILGVCAVFLILSALITLICYIWLCGKAVEAVEETDDLDGQSVIIIQNTGEWLPPESALAVFEPMSEDGPPAYGMPPRTRYTNGGGAEPIAESPPPTVDVVYLGPT